MGFKKNELEEYKKYLKDNNLIKSEYEVYNCYDEIIDAYTDYNHKKEPKDNVCPVECLEKYRN